MARSEIPWRTDEHGMLVGVRHHDSYICKLMFTENVELELEMRHLEGGPNNALALAGLRELNIAQFWSTPIVGHIFIWKIGADTKMRRVPDYAWKTLFANQVNSAEKIGAEAARIAQKRPEALLVHVTCSYGGELAAVCDRVLAYKVE